MNRGNLSEMAAFLAVVESGSFVSGAKMLGLSRSSTGKAMARLEERLGVRLLNRTTRKLGLSEDGRIFYDHCRQVMDAIDQAEASVSRASSKPHGVVRLSVPTTYGRHFVLPLMCEFMTTWPQVSVEINFTDKVVDPVGDGFDLTLRIGIPTTDAPQDTRFVSRVISNHRAILCASRQYLDRRGSPRTPEDLEEHDCIRFVSSMRRHVWRLRKPDEAWLRLNIRGRLGLDDGQAILDAALASQGIVYLPDFLVAQYIATGNLVTLLDDYETEPVPIYATYTSRKYLPSKTRHVLDHLAARLGMMLQEHVRLTPKIV